MKKRIMTLVVASLVSLSVNAQSSASAFIKKNLSTVVELAKTWGIPPSVIMGVALHESANGTSRNARELNNLFGIKGSNNLTHRTSAYRQFSSFQHSFNFFCGMLSRKKFYPQLKGNMNASRWIYAMMNANYASAREEWANKVTHTIRTHNLIQYDRMID